MFKALIVALAAVAAAIPTSHSSSSNNENKCGGEVRCCNKESVGQILPIDALSSSCSKVLSLLDILDGNDCEQQISCCNNVEQNGVVNVACTPIDAL